MFEELKKILVLQDRDQKIRALRRQVELLPKELQNWEQKILARQEQFKTHRLETQRIESERRKLDLDVQTRQQQIEKFRTQLLQTRKNEEYSALLSEIERAEQDIVRLEDAELELMLQYESAQKELNEEAGKMGDFEKEIGAQKSAIQHKLSLIQEELKTLESDRDRLTEGINQATLTRYERLFKSKGDAVIVSVVHKNMCGGCHMMLSPQTVLEAKSGTKMVSCENCGRFVFWAEE